MWNDEILRNLITSSLWRYGEWGKDNHSLLRFAPNGKVAWYKHYNEALWRLKEGCIVISHIDGMETVRFNEVHMVDQKIHLVGDFLLSDPSPFKMTLTSVDFEEAALAIPAPDQTALAETAGNRILVSLCFHFRAATVKYLLQVIRNYLSFPVAKLDVLIYTNASGEDLGVLQAAVQQGLSGQEERNSVLIKPVPNLDDPWLLPWAHKADFKDLFLDRDDYTHYIYSEDDLAFNFANFQYFVRYRDTLKSLGLVPAFCVTEYSDDGQVYAKEQPYKIDLSLTRSVRIGDLNFINHENPYNAFYILDKAMAQAYISSDSFDVEKSKGKCVWGIAERAAMGLCYENIPEGFASTYVVPLDREKKTIPSFAMVEHLPNKYVNEKNTAFSKILLRDLFT
ncbi:hypothetical protein [Acidocella facilis]|uniref:hypothetical protein n=1 Tax=Acidocella facilis TaxID=525 RepID=UPI0004788278|nr:hypothetical protein [Acidocella facilis]